MRPVRVLVSYLAVVFVGGALLAPLLYWLAQWLAGEFPQSSFLAHITHSAFHRFVSRAVEILALIGLWPLFRGLTSSRSASSSASASSSSSSSFSSSSSATEKSAINGRSVWSELGLTNPKPHWKEVAFGLALGFVSLALVAMIALACGERVLEGMHGRLGQKLLGAAATAIVVAVLEEILFRGALFGALRKGMHWKMALVISSAVYALAHFLQSGGTSGEVQWYSGLQELRQMLRGFADWQQLIPAFFTLMLAGVILALAYQRTGTLYFSIGLHAGWIFWRKSYGIMTKTASGANEWFWGTRNLIDGWLALGVILVVFVIVERLTRNKSQISNPSLIKCAP